MSPADELVRLVDRLFLAVLFFELFLPTEVGRYLLRSDSSLLVMDCATCCAETVVAVPKTPIRQTIKVLAMARRSAMWGMCKVDRRLQGIAL
jgi:hypothetical protein